MSREVNSTKRDDRRLARPGTAHKIWWGFAAVLALSLLAQLFIPIKGKVPLEGSFGFGAWYGFVCCVAIVLVARVLGWWLKRPEDYYADVGIEPSPQVKDSVEDLATDAASDRDGDSSNA